jgi:hypothetical protein
MLQGLFHSPRVSRMISGKPCVQPSITNLSISCDLGYLHSRQARKIRLRPTRWLIRQAESQIPASAATYSGDEKPSTLDVSKQQDVFYVIGRCRLVGEVCRARRMWWRGFVKSACQCGGGLSGLARKLQRQAESQIPASAATYSGDEKPSTLDVSKLHCWAAYRPMSTCRGSLPGSADVVARVRQIGVPITWLSGNIN